MLVPENRNQGLSRRNTKPCPFMKKYILLLLLFIASIGAGYGQLNKERQIEIFASASIDGTEFFIKITPGPDSTIPLYKVVN